MGLGTFSSKSLNLIGTDHNPPYRTEITIKFKHKMSTTSKKSIQTLNRGILKCQDHSTKLWERAWLSHTGRTTELTIIVGPPRGVSMVVQ